MVNGKNGTYEGWKRARVKKQVKGEERGKRQTNEKGWEMWGADDFAG